MKLPPLHVIATVVNDIHQQTDADWGGVTSRIVLRPEYAGGLSGLEDFSHVILLTYLHEAGFDPARHLVRHPRGDSRYPRVGIFAQRAKDRPNPIGSTVVRLLAVEQDALLVQGLDAIDGTPVLDIKPFFPVYDQPGDVRVPAWVDELMQGYF